MQSKTLSRRSFLGRAGDATAAIIILGRAGLAGATSFPVVHSPAEWRRMLGAQRYAVLRKGATEPPFSSALVKEHRQGTFVCTGCVSPVFSSATKFESGTGWPSFWRALPNSVVTRADRSLGMVRTEVICARCGGHLGHVFNDGPRPTGLRYCMNGLALQFRRA